MGQRRERGECHGRGESGSTAVGGLRGLNAVGEGRGESGGGGGECSGRGQQEGEGVGRGLIAVGEGEREVGGGREGAECGGRGQQQEGGRGRDDVLPRYSLGALGTYTYLGRYEYLPP